MIQKREEHITIFQHIKKHGTGDEFSPEVQPNPTNAPPGSNRKIEILIKRLESGEDLWNPADRVDFEGLTAPINSKKR